jgi:hypothetical protein
MDVVFHQAAGEALPPLPSDDKPEEAEVRAAIRVIDIHRLLRISPRVNVEDPTVDFFARPARHMT